MKTQTILDDVKKKFSIVHDCTGSVGEHEEYCQGCIEIIIVEPEELVTFLKEKLEKVEQDMIEKVKLLTKKEHITDKDSSRRTYEIAYNDALLDIINSLKEEKV